MLARDELARHSAEPALAFALLYQVMQIVPLLVTGLMLELNFVLAAALRESVNKVIR